MNGSSNDSVPASITAHQGQKSARASFKSIVDRELMLLPYDFKVATKISSRVKASVDNASG